MFIKRTNLSKALTLSVLAYLVQFTGVGAITVSAAGPPAAAISEGAMGKEVGLMENRFFAHQYANDPMEKRLERLELMIFGGTQEGNNDARFLRLKKIIAERPQASAKKALAAPAEADPKVTPSTADKDAETSSQYPVLNTLEWRALKKTFPEQSLDVRLGRLEQKLFGQDSPTMAYIDRVDRLKRTLGVGITAMQQNAPTGPAPKARPRNSMDPTENFGFFNGAPLFGAAPGVGGRAFGRSFGPEDDEENQVFSGGGLSRTINQMFSDMTREMQEFSKLGPGNWAFDQESGDWVEQQSGKKVHPGPLNKVTPGAPKLNPKNPLTTPATPFTMPMRPRFHQIVPVPQKEETVLPPYTDPNSI